jgi:3,4-dihydroxy 2-butanone 4-phosphate synthase/GTP cyclohydrolase II
VAPTPRVETRLPTKHGDFRVTAFEDGAGLTHLAVVSGDLSVGVPLVRVHSECLTGDVLGSVRCDCGAQLDAALAEIGTNPPGVVLYLRQEGRGIGLVNKLHAYNLQDGGLDTVDANLALGFAADARDFGLAADLLSQLGVTAVRLLTNNPRKVEGLTSRGIVVVERVPLQVGAQRENERYLATKRQRLGHLL